MRVDEFDFELPAGQIALRPADPRDSSKLLSVRPPDRFSDHVFSQLPQLCRSGDLLVFNDTKVMPVQLAGRRIRDTGSQTISAGVSATLMEADSDGTWRAFVKPARRLAPGDRVIFSASGGDVDDSLEATVTQKWPDGQVGLRFALPPGDMEAKLAAVGAMPLPPYIAGRRPADDRDRTDYQTVFAAHSGAVAAPTAGLHFTKPLMNSLRESGIGTAFLTLHVGPGTFVPVKASRTQDHIMHAERGILSPDQAKSIAATRAAGGRLIAVGTTSARLLEAAADASGTVHPFSGSTDIFISPGYRFRAVDALITNFHLPKSTLFMLVSAFCGLPTMKAAYDHAIKNRYRFYSYGDACLLFRAAAL